MHDVFHIFDEYHIAVAAQMLSMFCCLGLSRWHVFLVSNENLDSTVDKACFGITILTLRIRQSWVLNWQKELYLKELNQEFLHIFYIFL